MKNILVLIHGIVPKSGIYSHLPIYESFWGSLLARNSKIGKVIDKRIYVEWGHENANSDPVNLRPDERLSRAQIFVSKMTSYNELRNNPSEQNIVFREFGIPFLRTAMLFLKEKTIISGIGDAVYYCSIEGKRHVRRTVYNQILEQLDEFIDDDDVRLHIFAHSLGVTITNDFLFGLFAPQDHQSSFRHDGLNGDSERYELWKQKALNGKFKLGSLFSAAGQLPITLMRKQNIVDTFAENKKLNPIRIGVNPDGLTTKWKIFWDIDDILGFACRQLFIETKTIMDIQVNTGDMPRNAHDKYWENHSVRDHVAATILENALANSF